MLIQVAVEHCEAGSDLAFTIGELPPKLKDPKWTITGVLSDPDTGDIIAETPAVECIASSECHLVDSDWIGQVVPGGPGSLRIDVVMVDGKVQETASATVLVSPAASQQEKLERALEAGELDEVRGMLGGVAMKDASEEDADPEMAAALAGAAAELAPEGGWAWESSSTGLPLLDTLAVLKVAETDKLELLSLMVSNGATVPARPLRRSALPSALHWAIARSEHGFTDALLDICPPEALTAQCSSPLSSRVGFTPLHVACELGDAATVRKLVAKGAALDGPLGTPSPGTVE